MVGCIFGSSASQAKDHLVTGSLKGFRAARPIRVYPGGELERYWRLTPAQGSHHPFMGRHLHHGQVLHQSNTHPPPAPQHQPPPKNNTKDKAPVGTKNTHQPFIKPLAPKPPKKAHVMHRKNCKGIHQTTPMETSNSTVQLTLFTKSSQVPRLSRLGNPTNPNHTLPEK